MSDRLLIVDAVAPAPYSDNTLERGGLGGTEATVVRIAKELVGRGRRVTVAQRSRRHRTISDSGVEYTPYDHRRHRSASGVGAIIVVRAHKLLPRLRRSYPLARMFLWMHCFPGRRLRPLARAAVLTDTTVVAVSHHHRQFLRRFYMEHDPLAAASIDLAYVPNPIDDELLPDATPRDPDKLVFVSSPHKGLDQVLEMFEWLRGRMPSLTLYVANPGYLTRTLPRVESVIALGALPHREAIGHVRGALCLFYPQTRFAETFGLVFAEALAVGTPVLAHPLGAADEIVGDTEQIFDVTDREAVASRVERWRSGRRPGAALSPMFRRSRVASRWEALLASDYRRAAPPAVDSSLRAMSLHG